MPDANGLNGTVEGKIIIVTGAASGLGSADAAMLAKEGARVVLADINADLGEKLSELIPNSLFVRHDVRDEASWIDLLAHVQATHGRLDGLINNAGIVSYASVEEETLEQYRRINSVIAEGTFLGCKHAIPLMRDTGGGSIINISSTAAIRGYGSVAAYTAAKGAVVALTRSVAIHCKEQANNIRCNAVLPGAHDTPMTRAAVQEGPDSERGFETIRLGLQGHPDDVANLIVFLSSDASRRLNGSCITIDNGETVG